MPSNKSTTPKSKASSAGSRPKTNKGSARRKVPTSPKTVSSTPSQSVATSRPLSTLPSPRPAGSAPVVPPKPSQAESSEAKSGRRVTGYFFAVVFGALIFIFGFVAGRTLTQSAQPLQANLTASEGPGQVMHADEVADFLAQDVDFRQFWQIWSYLKETFVEPDVLDTQLFYGSLAGMVASLQDPYSVFLEPSLTEEFNQELSGEFEGIGAEIGIKDTQLQIIAPLPGNPAELAGLRAGDYILAIDDEGTRGMPLDVAVSKIRGEGGTTVVLTIFTEGDDEPRDVSIVRDRIEIDSVVSTVLEDGAVHVKLLYFNENTLSDWNQTVQEVIQTSPTGIILDLRNNPGGFLATAIEVAGDWANGNTIVIEQARDGRQVSHRARRQARLNDVPTVVLVNGGSASGSEIVAGALQDYGLATVVGTQTFGKGSVQDLREFSDGSSVKLTIAEWLTPNARNINHDGITPDIVINRTREDVEDELDPQLDAAVQILNGEDVTSEEDETIASR